MNTKIEQVALRIGVVACLAFAPLAHAGLVTNGGFETGDFTGWTQFGSIDYNFVDASNPHSGSSAASFGPVDTGGVSQTLSTIAGQQYAVSFWLGNYEGTPNNFSWSWNGATQAPSFVDATPADYTNYSGVFTATGATTELSFAFQNQTSFWLLDDVQVTDTGGNVSSVPLPGAWLLFSTGLGFLGLVKSRRRSQIV